MPAERMDLDALLKRAVDLGASDVHLKLGQPPVVRRDGELEPLANSDLLDPRDLEAVLHDVTAAEPARLEGFRARGELDVAYTAAGLPRFRVNGFRQRAATSFAFRAIPAEVPGFDELLLPPGVARLAEERRGMILVTGATGVGKTTTLAAVLDHINKTRRQHIVTIEDPIEFVHEDLSCIVNQREVGLDTDSFHSGLRSVLRQDPDVILIGELRDVETAETALQASESGHLVLSTMHTLDAAETIGRLLEFFPAAKHQQVRSTLAGTLRGVVSQRLLPRLDGGRVPAVEVLVVNARVADLIRNGRTHEIPEAIEDGSFLDMQSFVRALLILVLEGVVEREVAAAAAPNAHDFLLLLDRALKQSAVDHNAANGETDTAAALFGGRADS